MQQVIRAKPGTYKGVRFRSQLEIKWAQWFDRMEWSWNYCDLPAYDFEVDPFGFIEVKPECPELVADAIERALGDFVESGKTAAVCSGSPPSRYGMPVYFFAISVKDGELCVCSCDIDGLGCFTNQHWDFCHSRADLVRYIKTELHQ